MVLCIIAVIQSQNTKKGIVAIISNEKRPPLSTAQSSTDLESAASLLLVSYDPS